MRVTTDAAGRPCFYFRQSWISTYLQCPEKARREAFEGLRSTDTDATILGTAGHTAYEWALTLLRDSQQRVTAAELVKRGLEAYRELAVDPTVRWIQTSGEAEGSELLRNCLAAWHTEVYPHLTPHLDLERSFDVLFYSTDDYDVYLEGTIDCIDYGLQKIVDWKHKGDEMKQWQAQRWAVQPTVYSHAAVAAGVLTYPVTFIFVNALKRKTKGVIQVVEVQRTEDHAAWLREQLEDIIASRDVGRWLRNDTDWHCSPKWCPAWQDCKGKMLNDNTFMWKPSR